MKPHETILKVSPIKDVWQLAVSGQCHTEDVAEQRRAASKASRGEWTEPYVKICQGMSRPVKKFFFCIFFGLLGFWVEHATKGIVSSSLTRFNHFDFGLFGLKVAAPSILLIFECRLKYVGAERQNIQDVPVVEDLSLEDPFADSDGTAPAEAGKNLRGVHVYLLSLLEIDSGPRTLHKAPQRVQQIAIPSPAKKSTSLQVPESLAKDVAKEPASISEVQNRLSTSLK